MVRKTVTELKKWAYARTHIKSPSKLGGAGRKRNAKFVGGDNNE